MKTSTCLDLNIHTVVILNPSNSRRQVVDKMKAYQPLQPLTIGRRGNEDLLTGLLPNINLMEMDNRNSKYDNEDSNDHE